MRTRISLFGTWIRMLHRSFPLSAARMGHVSGQIFHRIDQKPAFGVWVTYLISAVFHQAGEASIPAYMMGQATFRHCPKPVALFVYYAVRERRRRFHNAPTQIYPDEGEGEGYRLFSASSRIFRSSKHSRSAKSFSASMIGHRQ